MADHMGDMPIRELITSLRDQARALPSSDMVKILFINALVVRIEEEADRADRAEGAYQKVAQALVLSDSSDPSRPVLDPDIYWKAIETIESFDQLLAKQRET